MKKLIYLIAGLLILQFNGSAQAQKLIKNKEITGRCYAGNKVSRVYIPPPDNFLKASPTKGGGSITVIYTGFTSQAKVAMEYAVSILRTMLPADTKFTIAASLEKLAEPNILGQSSITWYAEGKDIEAQNPLAYYPVALAEKIAGKSINPDTQADITLAINSSINWYFGTDGKPVQKYDLVTVILHEICHGLGFYDSMGTDGSIGYYGNIIDTLPMIYDTFVEDVAGKKLTDTLSYPNFSASLLSSMTGGQLYFNGPLFKYYSRGSRAKLYAPPAWDPGSSVSHLDESVKLRENSLMTPFIDKEEAIHDPGEFTFSILGDLGWINTRIIHNKPPDTEEHLSEIDLSVTIKSDTTYNHNKVGLVYSFDKFHSSDTIFMSSPGDNNFYKSTIGISSYNSELQYYFFTEDTFLRQYHSPSLYKEMKYTVFVGADTVKPVISHTPAAYYLETVDSLSFAANATDNSGVDSVYIEYKVNNGAGQFLGLKRGKGDLFKNSLNAGVLALNGGDSLRYRVFAVDSANIRNTAVLPKNGYFVTGVEDILSPVTSYSTDFSDSENDFLNSGFSITTPSGFSSPSLNTKHPYESPEDPGDSIEYTAMLRHPVVFDESGMLFSYNEIVLVEPGLEGSVFGSPDFFDYVVIEASKDNAKSWFTLNDGYDSRYVSSWETAFNNTLVGQNSVLEGDEGMIMKHMFFVRPSDGIKAGEKVLIRFRLYSDPFANGWGWLVDDLHINPLIDGVEKINAEQVTIYPNPGRGIIKINSSATALSGSPVRYIIYNGAGVPVKNDLYRGDSETLADISRSPPGFYFIVMYFNDGVKTIKYSLVK
jgi:hypothetical protein